MKTLRAPRPRGFAALRILPASLLLLVAGPTIGAGPSIGPLAAEAQVQMSAEEFGQDPSEMSQAELVSERRAIVPGDRFQIGLSIVVPEGWHTYWRNPGDAGAQTTVYWEADPDGSVSGLSVSEFRWPRPERWATPPFMSYGYGDRVLLPMDVEATDALEPGTTVRLEGTAEWLFCDEVCLLTDAPVALELDVVAGEPESDPAWAGRFAETRALLPVEPEGWAFDALHGDDRFLVEVTPPEGWTAPLDDLYFYPNEVDVLEHAAPQPVGSGDGGTVRIGLTPSEWAAGVPERLEGLIAPPADTPGWDSVPALAVSIPVEAAEPGVVAARMPESAPAASSDRAVTQAAADSGLSGFLIVLALAFGGGLLLNLMPCVFPVISLKILSFVNQAGESPARVRLHGVAFAAGVVLSFLALAGLLIAIRAGGADVGWGFQLQDPRIVAALAALLFLIGLNLLGVFEFGSALTRLGAVGDGGGYRDSFLTGVLATLVATPCTAPLMGAAIGAAFVRPPVESLAIFGGMGVGMATPYLVLSLRPALLERLPRPGGWMEAFRQLMAFPMFAVAIWLLWVFGLQTGIDGATALLAALLLLAMAVWIPGRAGSPRRPWVVPTALTIAVFAVAAGWHGARQLPASVTVSGTLAAGAVDWQPFAPDAVRASQAQGRPVFVDFTAAWCITCQVNKRTVLGSARVLDAFRSADVALYRADWTRRDAEISRALEELGRSGVPVYALYPPRAGADPRLLPEILTRGTVIEALEALDMDAALR